VTASEKILHSRLHNIAKTGYLIETLELASFMLPKFLYGTFKRYKDDTDALVKYIVDKAKRCGHEIKLQQAGHGLKATSGKKAFKATRKDVSQKITLKDLKNLANTIVESNIQISPVIVATARRAISLRKRCAN
jgi:hypothetical protein